VASELIVNPLREVDRVVPAVPPIVRKVSHPIFLIVLFLGFLTSCQSSVVKKEASVYSVSTGSTIIVHKDIQLIPGKTKAVIQGGRLVESLEFGDLFFPHCIFEVDKAAVMPRVIKAGKYRVDRVNHRDDTRIYQKLVHASQVVADGGEFVDYLHLTELVLSSPEQTNGLKLVCQHSDSILADYLGVEQIRATLGKIASLELPGQ